jgi:carbamoyl-phosphate synthase large subunit
MPYIYLKLAFNEKLPAIRKKINPLPNGLAWVRGMDVEPVLIPLKKIQSFETELKERLKRIK